MTKSVSTSLLLFVFGLHVVLLTMSGMALALNTCGSASAPFCPTGSSCDAASCMWIMPCSSGSEAIVNTSVAIQSSVSVQSPLTFQSATVLMITTPPDTTTCSGGVSGNTNVTLPTAITSSSYIESYPGVQLVIKLTSVPAAGSYVIMNATGGVTGPFDYSIDTSLITNQLGCLQLITGYTQSSSTWELVFIHNTTGCVSTTSTASRPPSPSVSPSTGSSAQPSLLQISNSPSKTPNTSPSSSTMTSATALITASTTPTSVTTITTTTTTTSMTSDARSLISLTTLMIIVTAEIFY